MLIDIEHLADFARRAQLPQVDAAGLEATQVVLQERAELEAFSLDGHLVGHSVTLQAERVLRLAGMLEKA